MTNLPVPHALLFDWDGTLIDNWDAIVAVSYTHLTLPTMLWV